MTNASELAQIRQQSNMKILANSIVTAVNNCKDQIKLAGERGTGSVVIPDTKAGDKVTIDGREYTVGSDGSIAKVTVTADCVINNVQPLLTNRRNKLLKAE